MVADCPLCPPGAVQGDLIPWTIGQQYQDNEFPSLSGARVVRYARAHFFFSDTVTTALHSPLPLMSLCLCLILRLAQRSTSTSYICLSL